MKPISIWAHQHKGAARFLIVLSYAGLNLIALFFAEALATNNIKPPAYLPYVLSIVFLIALICYPGRKEKNAYRHFYRRQKTMDALLLSTSFFMLVCVASRFSFPTPAATASTSDVFAAQPAVVKGINPFALIKQKTQELSFLARHWKQLKNNYRLLRKSYKDTSKGNKTALIILLSVLAAFLFLLVVALSCNLSCSGAEGAATLVFIFGTGLLVLLLIKAIHAVNRRPKKKKQEHTVTT